MMQILKHFVICIHGMKQKESLLKKVEKHDGNLFEEGGYIIHIFMYNIKISYIVCREKK